MSITDELREWASVEVPYKYGHQLTAIAEYAAKFRLANNGEEQ